MSMAEHKEKEYRMLMVLTSHDKLGDTKDKTGWYLPEAAHPYDVFKKAGVKMTWASPKGGEAPVDQSSVDAYKKDKGAMAFYKKKAEKELWENTVALKDIDPKDFDGIFVVGGYGVMWDLVGDKTLHHITAKIWEDGGIVSGVCHGPAALIGVTLSDGSHLVKGKEVACFSNAEEDVMKRRKVVPKTCEDAYEKAGAKYTKGKAWSDHVAKAGRLITGQNPMSAASTAKAVVKALKKPDVDDEKKDDEEKDDEEKFELGTFVYNASPANIGLVIFVACSAFAIGFVLMFARARKSGGARDLDAEPLVEMEETCLE